MNEEIWKRKITLKDRNWILKLINEKEIRQNSFTTREISKEENDKYWKKKLKRRDFEAFAIFSGEIPIGIIRIDKKIVSIAVSKNLRKKGIAFATLSPLNLKGCTAEIKPKNIASIKLCKKLGFKEKKIVFEKTKG